MLARDDFDSFMAKYKDGAVFDEVQNIPELLSYLQGVIDADRDTIGRFVITGSQNFALNEKGRTGMATLLSLSLLELNTGAGVNECIVCGGCPALHKYEMNPLEFFPGYVEAYLGREARQLRKIDDLPTFQKFIRLSAGRIAKVVDAQDIVR